MDVPLPITISVIAASLFALMAVPMVLARATTASHSPSGWALVVGMGLAAWLAVVALLAVNGAFRPSAGEVVPPLGVTWALSLVTLGALVAAMPPLRAMLADPAVQPGLVAVQVWRIAGLVFLVLLALGQLPPLFALPAGIGDVVTGVSAPLVARNLHRRAMAITWNLFGLTDLVLAIVLGAATNPGAARLFLTTPTSEVMTAFPMALIPAFLVPLSLGLHLVSLRFLFTARSPRTSTVSASVT